MPVPAHSELLTLEDWYSPDCQGVLTSSGQNYVVFQWLFDRFNLEPEQSVSNGEWGVHLSSWQNLESDLFSNAVWVVLDKNNNVVFGQIPQGETAPSFTPQFTFHQVFP